METNLKKLYKQSRTENINLRQTVEIMRMNFEELRDTITEKDNAIK